MYPMLQLGDCTEQFVPVGEYAVPFRVKASVGCAEFVSVFINRCLQLQSNLGFFFLDNKVRQDTAKERAAFLACYGPDPLVPVFWVAVIVAVNTDAAIESNLECVDHRNMRHPDSNMHVISGMRATGLSPLVNTDVALAVEKPGCVFVADYRDGFGVKNAHGSSLSWDVGEVGGNPMPGPVGRGRAIPSQAGEGDSFPGACNEQGPTAKAKVCSGLHGNMQRSAEMTDPVDIDISDDYMCQQVTDRNTDYIYLRPHADRQYVPLNPDRYVNNQDAVWKLIGWAGNMTTSGRRFQGILKD
jgi:hypothetical protein